VIDYQTKGEYKDAELAIAIVQNKLCERLRMVRNAGRTLSHVQIVERASFFRH